MNKHLSFVPPPGLTDEEAVRQRAIYGSNIPGKEGSRRLFTIVREIVTEPMFVLLALACILYFVLGQQSEGTMMAVAILIVSAISMYQDVRSTAALKALKEYTAPRVVVRRNNDEFEIPSEKLVPGDIIKLAEGERIPADALILNAHDLTVNESIITGESMPLEKTEEEGQNLLYQGTVINSGMGYATVSATGSNTRLGQIGKSIASIEAEPTPLQKAINQFVKKLAAFGISAFLLIWAVNFFRSGNLIESLFFGMTIIMSAIPEEIPVAFTSFMALGAFYMARRGIITRNPLTIENLGGVTVICLDKTGTITQNKMQVAAVYDSLTDRVLDGEDLKLENEALYYAYLASEAHPFDAMEKAIDDAFDVSLLHDGKRPSMIHEYPLEGRPPMMTHVYRINDEIIVAAKGAIERIFQVCGLDADQEDQVKQLAGRYTRDGFRILGVAGTSVKGPQPMPENQDEFDWKFKGFVVLHDPPKENIGRVLNQFYRAGIKVKLLTGDSSETAHSIAGLVGLVHQNDLVSGEEVLRVTDAELKLIVQRSDIFYRMFPEAKLKVIRALQSNGEVTAMTGDGVNDGPALRAADIGIALGRKGTELAREAASLILTDDNLDRINEAIRQGRKIYNNLKKAVKYIVSIHIPIILLASVPLLLGWEHANLFTPIHVIFLELIMGPTCSLFFEREPEGNVDTQLPRSTVTAMFSWREIGLSIAEGIVIASGLLLIHYIFTSRGESLPYVRTMVFATLVMANVFLTFSYRSFEDTVFQTFRYKNNLAPYVIFASAGFLALILLVPFLRTVFGLTLLKPLHFLLCMAIALGTVVWFELMKGMMRRSAR